MAIDGNKYPVTFLFDSGASVSLMSIDSTWTERPTDKASVKGVGGKQAIGQQQSCSFVLDCMPGKVFEPALVLLGTDFLSEFDEFCVDWTNNRIKLGPDWVYLTSTAT